MREIPSLWENSPLVNEEAMIKLSHHILQALQWNNRSRPQSSRTQNLIMRGRGCHTCPHSSVWAITSRETTRTSSFRTWNNRKYRIPTTQQKALSANWTWIYLNPQIIISSSLLLCMFEIFHLKTRCWGCSWKPLLRPLLQILLICISSLSSQIGRASCRERV